MLYFHTPKISENKGFSDTFHVYRKETLHKNGLRLQTNIVISNLI